MSVLGALSPDTFLAEYWQKKPLLVRGAFPGFQDPLSPEELAGLALEEDVESRLVLEKAGSRPWEVRHGPFAEDAFDALPKSHWTLLVQGVDRLVPDVAELLGGFRFIPNWRLDDVMISYASDQGSVGPHVDNYDVFLIQGAGKRRWQIGEKPEIDDDFVPGLDLKILQEFQPASEWTLEPGDMLYLPPRFAHHGVALGSSLTYSIGFRAPSAAEILSGFAAHLEGELSDLDRYGDPDLTLQSEPGEISQAALARVRGILSRLLAREEDLAVWFGRFVTEPKSFHEPVVEHDGLGELEAELRRGKGLRRLEGARLAFCTAMAGKCYLFAEGLDYPLAAGLEAAARVLTRSARIDAKDVVGFIGKAGFLELLASLIETGVLRLDD